MSAPVVYFPKRVWFYRPSWMFWRKWQTPIFFGSDEFGQHTLVIGIPGLVGIVIAYKWCDCEGEERLDPCPFPGCPCKSMATIAGVVQPCMVHDEDGWRYLTNEAA